MSPNLRNYRMALTESVSPVGSTEDQPRCASTGKIQLSPSRRNSEGALFSTRFHSLDRNFHSLQPTAQSHIVIITWRARTVERVTPWAPGRRAGAHHPSICESKSAQMRTIKITSSQTRRESTSMRNLHPARLTYPPWIILHRTALIHFS
jgi:hypothetical protein